MIYTKGRSVMDTCVVYHSSEWNEKVENGWITLSVDEYGIATMLKINNRNL